MNRVRIGHGAIVGALLLTLVGLTACSPVKSSGPRPPGVMMVGDSISSELSPWLAFQIEGRGRPFRSAAVGGCAAIRGIPLQDNPPVYSEFPWSQVCEGVPAGQAQQLNDFKPRSVVWLSIIETYPRRVDGNPVVLDPHPATPVTDNWLNELNQDAYARLTSTGAGLIIVTMPPATSTVDNIDQRMVALNDRLRRFVAAHPDVGLVDLAAMACPGGLPCPQYVGNIFLREADGIHFSDEGAAWAASIIGPRAILN